jgi:hypothetical protein
MVARLERGADATGAAETGGSTYTYAIWKGHPFEQEVRGLLSEFRRKHSALRQHIQAHNDEHPRPPQFERITVYGGLHVMADDEDTAEDSESEDV